MAYLYFNKASLYIPLVCSWLTVQSHNCWSLPVCKIHTSVYSSSCLLSTISVAKQHIQVVAQGVQTVQEIHLHLQVLIIALGYVPLGWYRPGSLRFGATKESMSPCLDGNLVAPLIHHRPSHLGSYSKSWPQYLLSQRCTPLDPQRIMWYHFRLCFASCYECKNKKSHTPRFGLPVAWRIHKLWTVIV